MTDYIIIIVSCGLLAGAIVIVRAAWTNYTRGIR